MLITNERNNGDPCKYGFPFFVYTPKSVQERQNITYLDTRRRLKYIYLKLLNGTVSRLELLELEQFHIPQYLYRYLYIYFLSNFLSKNPPHFIYNSPIYHILYEIN